MACLARRRKRVRGIVVPKRRFTVWAWVYFALYVVLPIMGGAFLLDLALYLLYRNVLGTCYALLCLFR